MAVAVDGQASGSARIGGWPLGAVVAAALLLHVVCWTAFATLSHTTAHHDMTEAYAWGQEWRWGYYKHPPFFAWMTAAWFGVFPRESWAFFLLSEVNAALGLAGAWAIARRLLPARETLAVLALLLLTPLYGIAAIKFNANTALLSLWPWTTYALIRLLERPSGTAGLAWSVAFGLLAAAAFLTKYYSGLLLVACLVAALLHSNARALFRSPAPYVAVLVGSAAIAPHVAWLIGSDYQTLRYAAATTQHPTLAILQRGAGAIAQAVAVHILPLLALRWSLPEERRVGLLGRIWTGLRQTSLRWGVALAFGPFLLSFAALALAHVRISAQFMIPIFFMVPTVALLASDERIPTDGLKRLGAAALAACLVGLVGGPVGALVYFKSKAEVAVEPRPAVAQAITGAWRDAFGTRLAIVSGDETYSQAVAFYSADRPSDFTAFNMDLAPWITRERVATSGLAVICKSGDAGCLAAARPWTTPASIRREIELVPRHLWLAAPPRHFVVILIPPAR